MLLLGRLHQDLPIFEDIYLQPQQIFNVMKFRIVKCMALNN